MRMCKAAVLLFGITASCSTPDNGEMGRQRQQLAAGPVEPPPQQYQYPFNQQYQPPQQQAPLQPYQPLQPQYQATPQPEQAIAHAITRRLTPVLPKTINAAAIDHYLGIDLAPLATWAHNAVEHGKPNAKPPAKELTQARASRI